MLDALHRRLHPWRWPITLIILALLVGLNLVIWAPQLGLVQP